MAGASSSASAAFSRSAAVLAIIASAAAVSAASCSACEGAATPTAVQIAALELLDFFLDFLSVPPPTMGLHVRSTPRK